MTWRTVRPLLAAGWGARSLAVADLNGDGKNDLALVGYSGSASVLLNHAGASVFLNTTSR